MIPRALRILDQIRRMGESPRYRKIRRYFAYSAYSYRFRSHFGRCAVPCLIRGRALTRNRPPAGVAQPPGSFARFAVGQSVCGCVEKESPPNCIPRLVRWCVPNTASATPFNPGLPPRPTDTERIPRFTAPTVARCGGSPPHPSRPYRPWSEYRFQSWTYRLGATGRPRRT